jgi:hypothetical protein
MGGEPGGSEERRRAGPDGELRPDAGVDAPLRTDGRSEPGLSARRRLPMSSEKTGTPLESPSE